MFYVFCSEDNQKGYSPVNFSCFYTYKSGVGFFKFHSTVLISQTSDWEWIIYDDSEDNNDTWNRLNATFIKDYRIT